MYRFSAPHLVGAANQEGPDRTHLVSVIRTASLIELPRMVASSLPSADQAKSKIDSVLKLVSGFASPLPSTAIVQIFSPLSRKLVKAMARPSVVQRTGAEPAVLGRM